MISTDRHGDLPVPEAAALAHSERLRERMFAAIAAGDGAISFSEFMNMALYEPGLGYYSAGSARFGRGGDFITAADLGDFLARSIVATLAPRLRRFSRPIVVELGAGTGELCAALLQQLDAHGLGHARYRILEPSPDLQARQRERLAAAGERIEWITELAPGSIDGSVIANEVADALPLERVVLGDAGWERLAVARDDAGFRWCRRPLPAALAERLEAIAAELPAPLPRGYVTELRPLLAPWIAALCAAVNSGDIMIIDYGMSRREYFHPQRDGGTLMCHYRHRAHGDPFLWPGLQDITAWVDFSECAAAAAAAGAQVTGYTTQGGWIAETLLRDDALVPNAVPDARSAAQLKTLMLPGEMGERFKVMLIGCGAEADVAAPLRGRDLREWL